MGDWPTIHAYFHPSMVTINFLLIPFPPFLTSARGLTMPGVEIPSGTPPRMLPGLRSMPEKFDGPGLKLGDFNPGGGHQIWEELMMITGRYDMN